jgi:hypothetical protein
LYSSLRIISVINEVKEHVPLMRDKQNMYTIFLGNQKRKDHLGDQDVGNVKLDRIWIACVNTE